MILKICPWMKWQSLSYLHLPVLCIAAVNMGFLKEMAIITLFTYVKVTI